MTGITDYGKGQSPGTLGQSSPSSGDVSGSVTGAAATDDASLLTSSWEHSTVSQSNTPGTAAGYNSAASNPTLQAATQTDPTAAAATLQHLFDAPTMVHNLVSSGVLQPSSTSDEEDEEVTDPEILAKAEEEGESPASLYTAVQAQATGNFNQLLNQLPASLLTQYPNAGKQLLFAFNNPGQASNLPPALQAQLQSMNQTVTSQLIQQYGFSSDWSGIPPDTEDFNATISDQYDASFEASLQSAAVANNLSSADVSLLQSMHYLPDSAATTTDPNLLAIFNSCQTTASASIEEEYGINPSTFPITADSLQYTQTLDGAYRNAMLSSLQQQQPPLTADQQQQIANYLADPQTAIDPNLATIAGSLKASAIASVIAQYGLNDNWQPTVAALSAPGTDPAMLSLANQGIATAKEMLQNGQNLVAKMPPGPQQQAYMNFLKAIGIALNNAQNAIYAIEGAQSNAARQFSLIQMQTQLDNLKQQQQSVKDTEDKQGKMANAGPGMGIVSEVLMDIVLVVVALALLAVDPVLGVMALTATIFSIVDSAVSQGTGKPSLTQQMFTAVQNAMPPAAAAAVNLILSVVASGGNPMLFMQVAFSDANVIGGFVAQCGGTQQQQMIATAVIQSIIMIAVSVAICVCTMGAAGEAVVASIMDAVSSISESVNVSVKSVQVAFDAVQCVMTALQVANQGIAINNNILLSQIDMIKGRSDAENEEIQGILAVLQLLISKLLNMLQSGGQSLVNIQTLQAKKYSDASDISTQITSAISY